MSNKSPEGECPSLKRPDEMMKTKKTTNLGSVSVSRIFGGSLLVAGTCIGAGMLGIPVTTASGGFYPTFGVFLGCWAMMLITAFLMLEVSLWFKTDVNLITMASKTLGPIGAMVAWVTYILFLYSLMAAYTAGGSSIFANALSPLGWSVGASTSLYVICFAMVVYFGARWVDICNRLLMLGLVLTYFGLTTLAAPKVDIQMLTQGRGVYLLSAFPVLVTAFGFHLLIPTLKNYLNNQAKALRIAIFTGSAIPFIIYVFWEAIVLGTVSLEGENGLLAIAQKNPVVDLPLALSFILDNAWVSFFAKSFGFFALLSSFIGVALGLFDFLADGFKIPKSFKGRMVLALLTFIPPALFAFFFPRGFLFALSYAGVFAAILLVMYPALMAYRGRYQLNLSGEYQVFGGKGVLALAFLFGASVIVLQFAHQFNWLPVP